MSKDFFKRKEAKKVELPTHSDYDFENFDNDLHACGINDIEGFQARHNDLFSNLIVDSDKENSVATVAKKIQEYLTPREVAFLMSKDLLLKAYEKSLEQTKEKN